MGDMMGFTHKGSHAVDKLSILKNIPTYNEIIKMVEASDADSEEKCLMGLLIMTGCRISEATNVKLEDVKIWDDKHRPLEIDYKNYPYLNPFDNPYAEVALNNLKAHTRSKKGKPIKDNFPFKHISLTCTEQFLEPYRWIITRLMEVSKEKKDPKARVITFSRNVAWWRLKRILGNSAYPHLVRHWTATNDLRLGLHSEIVRKKLGHRTFTALNTYSNLDFGDVTKQLQAVYGPVLSKMDKPLSVEQTIGYYTAAQKVGQRQIPQTHMKKEDVIRKQDGTLVFVNTAGKAREYQTKVLNEMPEVEAHRKEELAKAKAIIDAKKKAEQDKVKELQMKKFSEEVLQIV